MEAGAWPPPDGWANDLESPDFVPTPTDDDDAEPLQDIGVALRNAHAIPMCQIRVEGCCVDRLNPPPKSRHWPERSACRLSAKRRHLLVSIDHLIGAQHQRHRDVDT
jgi:hypothetical protein